MAEFAGIFDWYYSTFLNEYSGPDLNNLWVVSITPQESEEKFRNAIKMEAARFDVEGNAVDKYGIVDGWDGKSLAWMVDATWQANTATLPENLNIEGWGSNNVLIGVNNVMIPNDALNTKNAEMGPGYTWVPPMMADTHQPFQPLQLSFYYTAYPFSEFIVRPWTMAVNRYGLKLRCLRAHLTCTLFSRRNMVAAGTNNWIPKFQYIFYSCYPQGTPNITLDYNDDGQDKTSQISFGYDFYRMRTPYGGYSDIRHAADDFGNADQFIQYITDKTRQLVRTKPGTESKPDEPPKNRPKNKTMAAIGSFMENFRNIDTAVMVDLKPKQVGDGADADYSKDVGGGGEPIRQQVGLYEPVFGYAGTISTLGSIVLRVLETAAGYFLGMLDTPLLMFSVGIPVAFDEPVWIRSRYRGVDYWDFPRRTHFGVKNVDRSDEPARFRDRILSFSLVDEPRSISDGWIDTSEWDEVSNVPFFGTFEIEGDEPRSVFGFVDEVLDDEPRHLPKVAGDVEEDEFRGRLKAIGDVAFDEVQSVDFSADGVGPDEVGLVDSSHIRPFAEDEARSVGRIGGNVPRDEVDGIGFGFLKLSDDETDRFGSKAVGIRGDEVDKVRAGTTSVRRDEPERVFGFRFGVSDDEVESDSR